MVKLNIVVTSQYKKDFVKIQKQGLDINKLKDVIYKLSIQEKLDSKYKDHSLTGKYINFRECHISLDWLLIYRINNTQLELILTRVGSYSNLYN